MGAWRRCVALAAFLIVSAAPAAAETLSERGAYLANGILACANCHTPRDANGPIASKALSGGRVFDTPAFKVFSSNITPDKETGLGGWSDAELKKFMITGERPSGVPVAPIMPTAYYKALTPRDLDALIVYLRSVAPIRNEVAAADYKKPFGHEEAPFADKRLTEADMSDPVKRGMYLVTLGHCLECHTPDAAGKHDDPQRSREGRPHVYGAVGQVALVQHHLEQDDWPRRLERRGDQAGGDAGHVPGRAKTEAADGICRLCRADAPDQDAIVAFLRTLPPLE